MNTTLSIFRWATFIAAIPFLYFVLTDKPQNWLYHLSLGVILAAYVGQMVVLWRSGRQKEVKNKLLLAGLLLVIFMVIAFFN